MVEDLKVWVEFGTAVVEFATVALPVTYYLLRRSQD